MAHEVHKWWAPKYVNYNDKNNNNSSSFSSQTVKCPDQKIPSDSAVLKLHEVTSCWPYGPPLSCSTNKFRCFFLIDPFGRNDTEMQKKLFKNTYDDIKWCSYMYSKFSFDLNKNSLNTKYYIYKVNFCKRIDAVCCSQEKKLMRSLRRNCDDTIFVVAERASTSLDNDNTATTTVVAGIDTPWRTVDELTTTSDRQRLAADRKN